MSASAMKSPEPVAREQAPTAFLIGNIGAPQLVAQGESPPMRLAEVRLALDMMCCVQD